jgi:hypothetical protein
LNVGNTKIVTPKKRNTFAASFNGKGRFVTVKKNTTVMLKVYAQERWGRKQLMGEATLNDVCVAIKTNGKHTFSNFGSVKKVVVLFQKSNLLRRPPQPSKRRFVFNNQKVRKLIFAWTRAWEKTALRKSWAYELFYHPKFYDPIKNRDKAGHVGYKMKVGKKLRWIYLHMSKLRLKETHSPHLLKVTFRQFYACPRLRDRGTKTMLWKKHNGRWKIISERWRKQ